MFSKHLGKMQMKTITTKLTLSTRPYAIMPDIQQRKTPKRYFFDTHKSFICDFFKRIYEYKCELISFQSLNFHLNFFIICQHDYLKSYYEENEENYPGCLSDDQKQTCLPLYDFLCSAGAVLDLTNVWPTYVFLVEVFNRQNKTTIKTVSVPVQQNQNVIK